MLKDEVCFDQAEGSKRWRRRDGWIEVEPRLGRIRQRQQYKSNKFLLIRLEAINRCIQEINEQRRLDCVNLLSDGRKWLHGEQSISQTAAVII